MINLNRISQLFIIIICSINSASAEVLPLNARVPGGIAVIKLPHTESSRPIVKYNGTSVLVAKKEQDWYAVVGLGLRTKPGIHELDFEANNKHSNKFSVSHKKYPTQYISGVQKSKVNLTDQDYQRHLGEKKLIEKAKKEWRGIPMVDVSFLLPVKSRVSGLFGRRRVLNKQPRNPHSGLDLAAPTGTPVLSPKEGKIILTGDYFFLGKTVFIEHGQGLITLFGHLNKIHVANGDLVKQGDLIADVGATGRVSGPHLHWGVYLNRVAVDPLLFIEKDTVDQLISGKTISPKTRSASK